MERGARCLLILGIRAGGIFLHSNGALFAFYGLENTIKLTQGRSFLSMQINGESCIISSSSSSALGITGLCAGAVTHSL